MIALNPEILDGKKVVGAEGYILGEVDGIEVDPNSWKAHAFYVNLSDEATAELGFKKLFLRRIAVCLPTQLVKTIGEVITLNEPLRSLEDIAQRGYVTYASSRLQLIFVKKNPTLSNHDK